MPFIKNVVRKSLPGLLLMMSAQHAAAQVDAERSEYTGSGVTIESVRYTETNPYLETGFMSATRAMLYNVGKDMFLNAGGYWGTRTATFTVGLPLVFETKSEKNVSSSRTAQCYRIQGPFNGSGSGQGNSLGFYYAEPASSNDNIVDDDGNVTKYGTNKNGVYFDRSYTDSQGGLADWWFEKVTTEDGDNVYQIKATVVGEERTSTYPYYQTTYTTYTTYTLCANNPMTIMVYEGGNSNLVKALTDEELAEKIAKNECTMEHTYWKIVPETSMEEQFDNNYYKSKPADATFLMRAQSFNRMNRFNAFDNDLNRGWSTSGSITYKADLEELANVQTYDYDSGELFSSLQDKQNSFRATFGMFHCAEITAGKAGAKVSQKVTLKKSGWYIIDCQGLYNDKEGTREAYASLFAKFATATEVNTPGWSSAPLRAKTTGEHESGIGSVQLIEQTFRNYDVLKDGIVGDERGKISNKVEAGIAFYRLLYPNQVMIYANITEKDGLEMELGIEITDDMDSDDYIYVDDFRLRYLGESFALNENWDDFKLSSDNATYDYEAEYPNHVMILKREMTPGKWNTLCLPVDLTKAQLQGTFSANVKIAKLTEGLGKEGTIEFIITNLNNAHDDDVVLHRGEAYLINPGEGNHWDSGEIGVGDVANAVVTAPFYMISRVTLKKQDLLENEYSGVFTGGANSLKKFRALKYDAAGEAYEQDVVYGVEGDMHRNCGLKVYATFENQLNETSDMIPRNAYVFSGGKIYHLNGTYAQKGYSWWIEDEDQDPDNPSASRHTLAFATYMNGISDNTTTAIDGIPLGVTSKELPLAVYSVSGQAVRRGTTSVAGLPCGMYIVNGQKVFVR